MSESKLEEADVLLVDVTSISVEPNVCELTAPLTLTVGFTVDRPVSGASWHLSVSLCAGPPLPLPSSRACSLSHGAVNVVLGGLHVEADDHRCAPVWLAVALHDIVPGSCECVLCLCP